MKIAYLVNVYPRPAQTFIWREMAALEGQGVHVDRFALRRPDERVEGQADAEMSRTRYLLDGSKVKLMTRLLKTAAKAPGAFLRALALTGKVGRRSDRGILRHFIYLAEACQLKAWLEETGTQHVHCHYGTNTATIAMLTHVLGGPTFSFTAHGPDEFDRPEFLGMGEKIRRAAFVVAIAEYGRSQLYRWVEREHWGKIHVVRCGVDDMYLNETATPVPTDRRLVSVGRLSAQKGQLLLLEAAAQLRNEGSQFELVLVGGGELQKEIEQFIARHELSDTVKLAGWANSTQVRDQMLAARALVMPSFAEGLPVVVMESLALHRPVLSTYIAGIPELVEPGVCGTLVPAGALQPLVDAMRQMLTCETHALEAMGREGAKRVAERHNSHTEASRLSGLFRKAIGIVTRTDARSVSAASDTRVTSAAGSFGGDAA